MRNEAKIGRFTNGGQPSDDELKAFKAQGFTTVINIRPHAEQEESEQAKVEALGMNYVNVPYTAATVTPDDVRAVGKAVAASPAGGGVLIHCAGGTRSGLSAAIVEAEKAGTGAAGAKKLMTDAGLEIAGTPYEGFIDSYFKG